MGLTLCVDPRPRQLPLTSAAPPATEGLICRKQLGIATFIGAAGRVASSRLRCAARALRAALDVPGVVLVAEGGHREQAAAVFLEQDRHFNRQTCGNYPWFSPPDQ